MLFLFNFQDQVIKGVSFVLVGSKLSEKNILSFVLRLNKKGAA